MYFRWSSVCVFTFLSYLREFVWMCFGRLQERLTFKFSTVVVLIAAAVATVVWALLFRFFYFIIISNATVYGLTFCTFTRYIVLSSLFRSHCNHRLHFTLCVWVRVCALLFHYQSFMKLFHVCANFVLGPSHCSLCAEGTPVCLNLSTKQKKKIFPTTRKRKISFFFSLFSNIPFFDDSPFFSFSF